MQKSASGDQLGTRQGSETARAAAITQAMSKEASSGDEKGVPKAGGKAGVAASTATKRKGKNDKNAKAKGKKYEKVVLTT